MSIGTHCPSLTSSKPGLLLLLLVQLMAGTLTASLTSCHCIVPDPFSDRPCALELAETAWHRLENTPQGTPGHQRSLRDYNAAVSTTIKALARIADGSPDTPAILGQGSGRYRLLMDPVVPHGKDLPRMLGLGGFDRCLLAESVAVEGFDREVTRQGLGVPVVLVQDDPTKVTRAFPPPKGDYLPATAVLEFPKKHVDGRVEARLRFYNPMAVQVVQVGGNAIPLSENLTAPLQFTLTDATKDESAPDRSASSVSGEDESQLFFPTLYDPGKTPVVFVHGLRSGPVIWKNAINSILEDPDLRRRYQPVCFVYPSGLPIPTSSARLRQLLKEARATLDPKQTNDGFNGIVLVGHSMGGLLARMQVIDSGLDFWYAFFAASPKTINRDIDRPTRTMLRRTLVFRRLPNVDSVVFITTPHRGSEIADLSLVQSVAKVILALPKSPRNRFAAVRRLPPAVIHPALRSFDDWGNAGVENLSTRHPFFHALAGRPITVPFYSIIGIRDAAEPLNASDGVVPYRSAHLAGAVSETLVPFPHGCVEREGTVHALMKILKNRP